jgi:hypothetical protein
MIGVLWMLNIIEALDYHEYDPIYRKAEKLDGFISMI